MDRVPPAKQPSIGRAGHYVDLPEGYRAFLPAPLPPEPPLVADVLDASLARAVAAINRLNTSIEQSPVVAALEHIYLRREAVGSSAIEGLRSSLLDLLIRELFGRSQHQQGDVEEIESYVRASEFGLLRSNDSSISLEFILELHRRLFEGVKPDLRPGHFRTEQNYVAEEPARGIVEAVFVPPPVAEMKRALRDLEKWLTEDAEVHPLLFVGLSHAQFLTIHPFLDGNGRIGRILSSLALVRSRLPRRPLLYLSGYLRKHRREYYESLMSVRNDGDWERWLIFFLEALTAAAVEAETILTKVTELLERHDPILRGHGAMCGSRLRELMVAQPVLDEGIVQARLAVPREEARRLLQRLLDRGLLSEQETAGGSVLVYSEYLTLFGDEEYFERDYIQVTGAVAGGDLKDGRGHKP